MAIPSKAIVLAQKKLSTSGTGAVGASGALDPQTIAALDAVLGRRKSELDAKHRTKILVGDGQRKVTAYIQLLAKDAGVDPGAIDVFGGCFNKRKKRGGTSWSMHAWGIPLDYDPDNNQLQWGRDRATFARPALERHGEISLRSDCRTAGVEAEAGTACR